jgi:bifunctional DNase/RNase
MAVQVELKRIIITETSDQQVIFLKEIEGERRFPIVIGSTEALAIDRRLKGMPTPRPYTHELLSDVIEKLGGTLERIVINDLQDHTFFARLVIRQNGKTVEIDSRPSDAIALGVAHNVPVFVADHVMNEVGQAE